MVLEKIPSAKFIPAPCWTKFQAPNLFQHHAGKNSSRQIYSSTMLDKISHVRFIPAPYRVNYQVFSLL
jgi:hypothetical protein